MASQTLPAQAFQGSQKEHKGKGGGRSPTASPLNVATPSRGGRGGYREGGNGGRDKGPASALEDLMRRKGVDEAWTSLEEMQTAGTTTDKYTVSRMLMKTVGDGRSRMNNARVYRAIGIVDKFIDMQPTDVDEVLFNALLDTCGRLKDLPRLETTVQRMRDLKVTPSPVTLGILVKTYGQAGDIQKVLNVWKEMDQQRVQANAVTYGCMIDACVKCGHLSTAVEIFKGMREAGKHRNTILYTTLIKGYGLDKDLKSALELFREMPSEGVPYNTITYNSIIDACVKSGDLTTAEAILREIAGPTSSLEPDLITFSTLLKGYCHIGDLDKALQLCEAIKGRGLRCDELVYNTLMDGCVKANDVTAGVGLFEEMVQQGFKPSTITHSILARLYQHAGYQEDALEAVAQLYAHHGIERPVGGERGKGAGRSGRPQRSPGASPHGSPASSFGGFGARHERADSWCGGWSETQSSCGFDAFCDPLASGASTPHGSPMQSQQNGMFLPFDGMRGMPPLPGMGGSDTPHSSSCRGATPVSGAFHGSPVGSPYQQMPYVEQQGQVQGQMMAPAAMPSLPPFPFAPQAQPQDAAMQQFFIPQQPQQQQQQQPMQAPQQAWGSPMGGAENAFPMPGPPSDMMAYGNGQNMGYAMPAQQGAAYFEGWTNQQVGGGGPSPFCL